MTEKILAICKEESGGDVSLSSTLEDLKLDSLELILLVQRLNDEVGPLDDSLLPQMVTVGDIVKHYQ